MSPGARSPRIRRSMRAPATRRSLKTQQHAAPLVHATDRAAGEACQVRSTCLVTGCAQRVDRRSSRAHGRLRHPVPSLWRAP
jgi:hypothetical protein